MSEEAKPSGVRGFLATLVRKVPVRVLDISRAGCRLESPRQLDAGTSGELQVSLGDGKHDDDVRIARCQRREGAGQSYYLGAELLATRRLGSGSFRLAIERLISSSTGKPEPAQDPVRDNGGLGGPRAREFEETVGGPPPAPAVRSHQTAADQTGRTLRQQSVTVRTEKREEGIHHEEPDRPFHP